MKQFMKDFRSDEDPGEALANMLMLIFASSMAAGFIVAGFILH